MLNETRRNIVNSAYNTATKRNRIYFDKIGLGHVDVVILDCILNIVQQLISFTGDYDDDN